MIINTTTNRPEAPNPKTVSDLILSTLDENKAEDIAFLPLEGKSDMAYAMIVANGRSNRHVGALADYVSRAMRTIGIHTIEEGFPACDWVLLDCGDVIVHLFRPEVRNYYNLERMWGPPEFVLSPSSRTEDTIQTAPADS